MPYGSLRLLITRSRTAAVGLYHPSITQWPSLFWSPFTIIVLLIVLTVVTQTRGHVRNIAIAGSSSPPTTVRFVSWTFTTRARQPFLPSSTCVESWDVSTPFLGVGKKRRGWMPRMANPVLSRLAGRGKKEREKCEWVRGGSFLVIYLVL